MLNALTTPHDVMWILLVPHGRAQGGRELVCTGPGLVCTGLGLVCTGPGGRVPEGGYRDSCQRRRGRRWR